MFVWRCRPHGIYFFFFISPKLETKIYTQDGRDIFFGLVDKCVFLPIIGLVASK